MIKTGGKIMIKKLTPLILCLSLLVSTSIAVFAEKPYTFRKIDSGYSILTGEVTKISNHRIKLSKVSDDLWSDRIGDNNEDFIMLDTTNFEDNAFHDGNVIRAYFTTCSIDYRSLKNKNEYAFELCAYQSANKEISVEDMANFLEKIDVLVGYEDGELHLDRNITRAEFTTLVLKIYNEYDFMSKRFKNDTPFPFQDVPKDHWARKYLEYAFSNEIINGKRKDTFAPDESITVQDCIIVLLNASPQHQRLLNSAKAYGGYPDGYVKIAKDSGIISDQEPEKFATRGDVAAILYNAYNHETNFQYNIYAAKPVVYLYPEKKTDVSVNVSFNGDFTFTYPEFSNGWNVTAKTDGTLVSGTTEYPYLFWEGKVINYSTNFDEGFIVSRKETVAFLEEKLKILGLNEKERADFITYWAPQLIKNDFNIIKFDSEEYASKVTLDIAPQPDCMIRVFMTYQAANGNESIKKQELKTVERKGFVAVEWGGSLIE